MGFTLPLLQGFCLFPVLGDMFKNLKIWQKIALSLSLPILILIGVSLWSFLISNDIQKATEEAKNDHFHFALLSQKMDKNIVQIQQWLTDISATRGLDGLNDGFDEAETNYQQFNQGYEEFKAYFNRIGASERLQTLELLKIRVDAFYEMGKRMAKAYIEGGPEQGNKIMADFDVTASALSEVLVPFTQFQTKAAADEMQHITDMLARFKTLIVFFALAAIGSSILFGMFTVVAITRPLRHMTQVVKEVAQERDLTKTIGAEANDEVGQTVAAFEDLLKSFGRLIKGIYGHTNTLSSASTELTATAAELEKTANEVNQGAEHSSAAILQSSTSLKQLAEHSKTMNDRIAQVQVMAQDAKSSANEGKNALSSVQSVMSKISESSQKIIGFMDEISQIGSQTNLLSLNAGIEAAKAGEFGKGFAVVAEEVKLLSERSATSIEKINRLIEVSFSNVLEGTNVINNATTVFDRILQQVEKISSVVSAAASAMQDQGRRTIEISKATDEINDVSASNSAAINQLSASVGQLEQTMRELNRMAEGLHHELSLFKV